VETVSAELSLRDSDNVALYLRYFVQLWDIAEHGESATGVIRRLCLSHR
jgi:hypothetical protein